MHSDTKPQKQRSELINRARLLAEADLEAFIKLVAPGRMLGQVHLDLIRWWTRDKASSHQLVLLPRDHQKSALVAYRVAWEITKNPTLRVLYISSTANLAYKQLKFIKDIITSDIYSRYWPDMVNKDEGKREKWTESEIAIDHPLRKKEAIRDPTIFTAGLTTNIVGLHCDIAVLDDVVVDDTAYSEEGREKVRNQVSYLASIAGTGSRTWVVGTRYHPKDLYFDLVNQIVEIRDDEGDIVESYNLYEHFERQVEDRGDGSGNFLWPKTLRYDGKPFGFDIAELAKKKAQYADITKFRAQYYNNPNDLSESAIKPEWMQYYNPSHVRQEGGQWYYKNSRLNLAAAVDFAYSLNKKADYSAIAVVGVDSSHNYYVLDIERFRTNQISEYFDRILRLHHKWGFKKLRAEVTAAQEVIVKDLKENYIRVHGLALSIDEHRPLRNKEEWMGNVLQSRYQNRQMWHYSGGNCSLLEEELVQQKPAHDDLKDALASAVEIVQPPSFKALVEKNKMQAKTAPIHPRFGGVV
jgi:hypothetical protein